ncbi:hypothetical protein BpHYR1_019478 [Brachionus plicatilis]|uniref:Secreted protein n=1 Tax=Brachionus plicatilis TaxID=10195 RepID=A0A3M7RCM1_BRAPC|nr:hypothetical protein BpHYR1_019478 [Brachionus plicatilis]
MLNLSSFLMLLHWFNCCSCCLSRFWAKFSANVSTDKFLRLVEPDDGDAWHWSGCSLCDMFRERSVGDDDVDEWIFEDDELSLALARL